MNATEPPCPPGGFGCRNGRQPKPDVTHVGTWRYDEHTAGSHRLNVAVDSNDGQQTVIVSTWQPVELAARLCFPADREPATDPSHLSAARPSYPFIVLPCEGTVEAHDTFLVQLARDGFVAAGIELPRGLAALAQADVVFAHLAIIREAFGPSIRPSIGLLGFGPTAATVLDIARVSRALGLGPDIDAAIGLAPDATANIDEPFAIAISFFKRYLDLDGARHSRD
jgi:hypothetical protein